MQKNDRDIAQLRAEVLAHAEESAKHEIERMIDEQLLDFVRQSCAEFSDKAQRIINGNLPFSDAYEQLAKLEKVRYRSVNDLDAIAQDETVPPAVRDRARAAITRLRTRAARGFRTPEPILIRASLCRANYLGVTLNIIAVDRDCDTVGLRIKEAILAPDGQIRSVAEDYPAYIRGMGPVFDMDPLLMVTIRDSGQSKDSRAWEAFLIDSYDWFGRRRSGVANDQRTYGLSMPPVWISVPEPDKVRVFVCLYDRQRHESDYVEVENHLSEKPVDPFTYTQMFLSGLEEQSNQ